MLTQADTHRANRVESERSSHMIAVEPRELTLQFISDLANKILATLSKHVTDTTLIQLATRNQHTLQITSNCLPRDKMVIAQEVYGNPVHMNCRSKAV